MFVDRQRLRSKWEWIFVTTVLLSAPFFLLLFGLQWFQGDGTHWKSGRPKGGDLMQHYAAGMFWKHHYKEQLYKDFHLGKWINTQMGFADETKSIDRLNYVYAPLVGWTFSKFTFATFYWWIQVWMWSSLLLFIYLWQKLLNQNGFGAFPLERRHDIFWYGMGLPSLFYALWTFQTTVLFLATLIAAMFLWKRDKKFDAGLILSFWVIKPHLLVMWVLVLFLLKHYRAMWGCITGAAGFFALSILITGWQPHVWWFTSLMNVSDGTQLVHAYNSSWRVFWVAVLGGKFPLMANILYIVTAIGLITLFLKWIKEGRRRSNWISTQELPAMTVLVLLISPYTGHYEWLLALVWALAVYSWTSWTKRSALLLISFTAISFFSVVSVATQICLTPLFMTLWLAWSFQEMIRTQVAKENANKLGSKI
jgi:hypothetical protein